MRKYRDLVDGALVIKDQLIDHYTSENEGLRGVIVENTNRLELTEKLVESGKQKMKAQESLIELLEESIKQLKYEKLLQGTIQAELEKQISLAKKAMASGDLHVKLVLDLGKILECSICKNLPDEVCI